MEGQFHDGCLEQQLYQHQQHQQHQLQGPIRRAPLKTSSSAIASHTAGYNDHYQGSAGSSYATSSLPQIGYHATGTAHGQHNRRQPPSYPANTYYPTVMYHVLEPASTQYAPVHNTSQQYSSRQPSGMPLMAPAVTGYSYQDGPTSVPGTASAMQLQAASRAFPVIYQQPSNLQSYSTNSMRGVASPTTGATPDVSIKEQASPTEEDPMQSFEQYDNTLRKAFRDIRDGNLVAASESLIGASTLLCESVSPFGLVSDDTGVRPDRKGIWTEFNYAWLALLQRQKDKDLIEAGQQLERTQSILTLENLKGLGDKLVELSDKLERLGLVDYECGLWEEQIVDILDDCVEQYEPKAEDSRTAPRSSSPRQIPSTVRLTPAVSEQNRPGE